MQAIDFGKSTNEIIAMSKTYTRSTGESVCKKIRYVVQCAVCNSRYKLADRLPGSARSGRARQPRRSPATQQSLLYRAETGAAPDGPVDAEFLEGLIYVKGNGNQILTETRTARPWYADNGRRFLNITHETTPPLRYWEPAISLRGTTESIHEPAA